MFQTREHNNRMKNPQHTTHNLQRSIRSIRMSVRIVRIAFLSWVVGRWLLVTPFSALANNHLTDAPGINLTVQGLLKIITGLACWITQVVLVFIVVAVVYFGVKFLRAQGDPTKLGDAKKSFLWGLVGIVVILGTYTIIATVATNLGITDLNSIIPLSCPAF